MAGRSYNQRFKSLCVLQILLKYTDNDNPLTKGEIVCELLNKYGIKANEHSVEILKNYNVYMKLTKKIN